MLYTGHFIMKCQMEASVSDGFVPFWVKLFYCLCRFSIIQLKLESGAWKSNWTSLSLLKMFNLSPERVLQFMNCSWTFAFFKAPDCSVVFDLWTMSLLVNLFFFFFIDIFRNQRLLQEYKDFWGNTKVSSLILLMAFCIILTCPSSLDKIIQ